MIAVVQRAHCIILCIYLRRSLSQHVTTAERFVYINKFSLLFILVLQNSTRR